MKTFWKFVAALVALSTSACGNGPRLGESGRPMAVSKLAELPPPTGADLVVASSPYRIGPFDKLDVAVFGVPELSGKFQVDAAARLSLPLAGTIDAAGLTPASLRLRSISGCAANTSKTRRSASISTKRRARCTRSTVRSRSREAIPHWATSR